MLSIEECKKIINAGERQFSDEEVVLIRDFLYELAQIAIEAKAYQRQQRKEKSQPQRLIKNKKAPAIAGAFDNDRLGHNPPD